MAYLIDFRPSALRALKKLPRDIQRRIGAGLTQLSQNPFPLGCKKLANEDEIYRIRVGDYRVLYHVEFGRLLILVLKIGHRREIYR